MKLYWTHSQKPNNKERVELTERLVRLAAQDHMKSQPAAMEIRPAPLPLITLSIPVCTKWRYSGCIHDTTMRPNSGPVSDGAHITVWVFMTQEDVHGEIHLTCHVRVEPHTVDIT